MSKDKGIEFTGVFKNVVHRGEKVSLWEFHADCGQSLLIGVNNELEKINDIQLNRHCSINIKIYLHKNISENNIVFLKNRISLVGYEAIEQKVM